MKIAVTKLEEKSEGLSELFRRYGHEAVIISTMRASGPSDPNPLLHLAKKIAENEIDMLVFTSALGVEKLFENIKPDTRLRIVSVGPKTAKKVGEYGRSSEVIPSFSSENFAEYLGDINGKTIGIARADVLNPALIESLRSRGATVIEAPAYRLEPSGNFVTDRLRDIDALVFTSARSFEFSGFTRDHGKNITVVAIGEKTAEAMRKRGVHPDIVGSGTLESCLARLEQK